MCTLQEHKSSRIPGQDKESLATGNSQMHRTEPCGGLGDAETKGTRTFASAAQILPIGAIGSRGVRKIFFSECRQGSSTCASAANQECTCCGVRKGRLVPTVVAKMAPKPGTERRQAQSARPLGSTGRARVLVKGGRVLDWYVGQARGQEHCGQDAGMNDTGDAFLHVH